MSGLPLAYGPNICARIVPEPQQSEGGILLPETLGSEAQDALRGKWQRAVVVSVGEGRVTRKGVRITPTVKPGDIVLLARWLGTEVVADKETYVYLKEDDVAAVLT